MAEEIPLAKLATEIFAGFKFFRAFQQFGNDSYLEFLRCVAIAAHDLAPPRIAVDIANQANVKLKEIGPCVRERGKERTTPFTNVVKCYSDAAFAQLLAQLTQQRNVFRTVFGDFQDKLTVLRQDR